MEDMPEQLLLVKLNIDQIGKAKEINGPQKKITHALLCGQSGQIFGTEKQCMKYYSVWKDVFPLLFDNASVIDNYPITRFESTFNLVLILIDKHKKLEQRLAFESKRNAKNKTKRGILAKLFG